MSGTGNTKEKTGFRGISLNYANIVMIVISVLVAFLMIQANIQTNESYHQMDEVISESLLSQESTGKMESISSSLSSSALAFVETGDPSHIFSYTGQLAALNTEFSEEGMISISRQKQDPDLAQAVNAFNALRSTEWTAMRLKAETLPMPLSSLPEAVQKVFLSDEDTALSAEEKLQKASDLLNSPEYIALKSQLSGAVDASHRYVSEQASLRTAKASAQLGSVVLRQRIFIIAFIALAFLTLIMNRMLVLRPIKRIVELLDRKEKLPVRGSSEMRHMADVYNDVLQDNQRKTQALAFTATHDALTGVYNRAAFDKAYKLYRGGQIGILIVDVDWFKHFNDDYGHDVGDRVLARVAEAIKHACRKEDYIGRFGGDEFCVILMNVGQAQAERVCETVEKMNKELSVPLDGMPPVTISVGVAFWDRPDPSPDILKDADTALLQIKKTRSSNCYVYGT